MDICLRHSQIHKSNSFNPSVLALSIKEHRNDKFKNHKLYVVTQQVPEKNYVGDEGNYQYLRWLHRVISRNAKLFFFSYCVWSNIWRLSSTEIKSFCDALFCKHITSLDKSTYPYRLLTFPSRECNTKHVIQAAVSVKTFSHYQLIQRYVRAWLFTYKTVSPKIWIRYILINTPIHLHQESEILISSNKQTILNSKSIHRRAICDYLMDNIIKETTPQFYHHYLRVKTLLSV